MKNKSNINYKNLLSELQKLHLSKNTLISELLSPPNKSNLRLEVINLISLGIYECIVGVKKLIPCKNVMSSSILLRTIFEGLVNIRFISKYNTPNTAASFVLYDIESSIKAVKKIKYNFNDYIKQFKDGKYNSIDDCKQDISKLNKYKTNFITSLKDNYKINPSDIISWTKINIEKRSLEAGLILEYIFVYKNLCDFSHLNMAGLKIIFKLIDNKEILKLKKNNSDPNPMLRASCLYYYISIIEIFKKFKIYNKKDFLEIEDTLNFLDIKN